MTRLNWTVATVAEELGFPEGPIVLGDGRIALCDIHGGVVRILAEGHVSVLANLGGGPNGLALGPDGSLYVANNGGSMRWHRDGDQLFSDGFRSEGFDSRIERIDLNTGEITRVLDRIEGRRFEAIDDLVYDGQEGFWFTDLGRDGERSRTYGGIYWTSMDGSRVVEAAYPLAMGANGIGLSPDGRTLYATEYGAGRLWSWQIEGPGKLRQDPSREHGGTLLWQSPQAQLLDSIAVTRSGFITMATQPSGEFTIVAPDGKLLAVVPMPEPFPTNMCFEPGDPDAAYATLSRTGRLARIEWDEAALSEIAEHKETEHA